MALFMYSSHEIRQRISDRARARRLARGWTQAELAERAGIVLATLKKFEHSGQISLDRLIRIAAALDDLASFGRLFEPPVAASLDELEARMAASPRKYGRRRGGSRNGAT